jgi:hypothetical protein
MKTKYFLILAGIFALNICYSTVIIDNSYKAKSEIKDLIPAEKTALADLNIYLNKIFGKTATKNNKFITLKYDKKLNKEEFIISNDNNWPDFDKRAKEFNSTYLGEVIFKEKMAWNKNYIEEIEKK